MIGDICWPIKFFFFSRTPVNKTCASKEKKIMGVKVMVLNATFNDISVILWRSVLLMEETGVPGENHRPVASH